MEKPDYVKLYSTPDDYKPPEDHDLRHDSQYPNLNSKDYRKKPINRTPKILPFYEKLAMNNSEDLIILATNDIRSRIWDGYIWGFPSTDTVGKEEKSVFKIHSDSPITNLSFICENIFTCTQANGTIQLWSTKSDMRSLNDYCLFMIGEKCEHLGLILAMDIIKSDNNKIVTGCSEGCLKIWDIGSADIFSIHTIRFAHSDAITDIATSPNIFATSSRDKSALLWDYRLPRPATSLFENHNSAFTAINWSQNEKNCDEKIFIGDESGNILLVDPKMPNKTFAKIEAFNKPIRKIELKGNQMAVIGNINCVKVFNRSDLQFDCIYKNMKSENFIRDVIWKSDNEIVTIGWDSKLRKHVISKGSN